MKKLVFSLILLFCSISAFAQDSEDVGWVARFGIAGGFNPAYVFPNLDAVNSEAMKMGLSKLSDNGLITWGGAGFAYVMLVENLRIGGIGLSGRTSSIGNVNGLNREIGYNFGLGGATIEYTLPFIQGIAFSIGGIVGVGSQSIEIFQNRFDYKWESLFGKITSGGLMLHEDVNYKIKNTFFTIAPTLNIDLAISRFAALRLGGGYIINFNDSWKINNDRSISGIPASLTENNFFIQTGIFIGFIAF
ncbi:MAG: hypothetical protein FJ214_01825 [Ignavibacteria bacterium]|nr:hypothetical protein [Ignavibacteria bacterium]